MYSLHREGWKRQRVSWLIPAKNIRIEQFVFVVPNNRLFDFNPFHLLVLLVIFFYFRNENIRIRFTLDRDIYISRITSGKKFRAAKLITLEENLSRIWFCFSIPFEIVGSKTFQFAPWIRNWNIFKEPSLYWDLNKFTFKSVDQVCLLVNLTNI